MPQALTLACFLSSIYVFLGTYALYSKFRGVYRLLFRNENLLNEIKRLMRVFPEAVVIQSTAEENKGDIIFKNQEFESSISDMSTKLEELSSLCVSIETDNSSRSMCTNLLDLLKRQEVLLKGQTVVEKHKVKIHCKTGEDSNLDEFKIDEGPGTITKIYNIKSLKVDWADTKDAIMHVFIDTTYLYKLEEANTNIRCQKIMFASASHEFRTPLNAIINSYEFIRCTHQNIMESIKSEASFNKTLEQKLEKYDKTMEKFINIGSNSSNLLCALIEDVLNLSKIESGTFKINLET